MSYTQTNNPEHNDKPNEWLNTALIFTMALGNLIQDRIGIIIDIKGDAYNPVGDSNKVIVFRRDNMIHIDNFPQDLPEGTICEIRDDIN